MKMNEWCFTDDVPEKKEILDNIIENATWRRCFDQVIYINANLSGEDDLYVRDSTKYISNGPGNMFFKLTTGIIQLEVRMLQIGCISRVWLDKHGFVFVCVCGF